MDTDAPPDGSQTGERPFVVVGLGASAGGLEALEAFFGGLPTADDCAFVVVIHLAPDRESEMAAILARTVPLPVVQVSESNEIRPGHVYVVPPNRNIALDDEHIRLSPIENERRERRPIDYFFRSLAAAYGNHAVAVVLSGTGHNGTVGIRAVKEAGGLVLAQQPADASFDEMPSSAIASGAVDTVAPAGALAAEATAYADRLRRVQLPVALPGTLPHDDVRAVQRVLAQLRARTGHDFAHYKRSTVLRRLERRLHVVGADTLDDYVARLREDPAEARDLLQDLLISVTNFFRDHEAFAALEQHVIPALFEGKGPEDEVRVWVAACSTGEEAYSVAMLLAEHAATLDEPPDIQVFATDLSDAAVRVAREGVYPESIEADVSAERLRRFFRQDARGYRVSEALRELVLFAPHSLLKDPPFSHVDLVTCRNLLIYFQRVLQQRALELFHYAVVPGGYLFLGTSETADVSDGFRTVDKGHRIYQRREVGSAAVPYIARGVRERTAVADLPEEPAAAAAPATFADLHRRLRAEAAPPSVLVSADHNVVHLSEGAGDFLQFADGEPTRNVFRLVRPELRLAVQTALFQALRQSDPVVTGGSRMDIDGQPHEVSVRVRAAGSGGLVQILFVARPVPPDAVVPDDGATADDLRLAALVAELHETREQLQLSIEEFETSTEELQAQNEELQSTNEELRSTAEELETSKEEAQSMAEELLTVNDEMKGNLDELVQAKSDLENLIVSTEIATLFLDRQLCIKWFTPHVRTLFHVRSSDVGRPLADLAQRFGDVQLAADAEAVLARLQVSEREIRSEDGRWYLVHVRPYRTVNDHIDGVVVTFVEVSEQHRVTESLRESEVRYRTLFTSMGEAFSVCEAVLDDGGAPVDIRFIEVNPAFDEVTGIPSGQVVGRTLREVVPEVEPEWIETYGRVAVDRESVRFESRVEALGRWFDTYAFPVGDAEAGRFAVLFSDVSERKRSELALRQSEAQFRALTSATSDVLYRMSPDWTEMRQLVGGGFLADTEAPRRDWQEGYIYPDDRPVVDAAIAEAVRARGVFELEHRIRRADGTPGWTFSRAVPLLDEHGEIAEWFGAATDVTPRRQAEEEVRSLNATLESNVAKRTSQVRRLAARLTVAEQAERQRIAHVLHDDLQQQLYGLSMNLALLQRAPSAEAVAALTAKATKTLDAAVQIARTLATELSPAILQADRLADVLDWVARDHEKYGLTVQVEIQGDPGVADPALRILLYQALREVLFNVVKHAGETAARLVAWAEDGLAVVRVEDSGAGFAVHAAQSGPSGGFGLFSVRERLELVGGRFEIDSAPGEGTRVVLAVPSIEGTQG